MAEDPPQPPSMPEPKREDRLAARLRDNLARRKAQARANNTPPALPKTRGKS